MKRAWLTGAAVLAALVTLYAGAGYLLAPGLIRDALVERARAAGFDLRVEKIGTSPFTLSVELHDVQASTRKGAPLLYVQRATADLSVASVFSRAWVIQRVALEQPVLTALPPRSSGSGGALPRLEVREAAITDGIVQLAGQPRISDLTFTLHELSTFGDASATYAATARVDGRGQLTSRGQLQASPLGARGNLSLESAALASAWRFLPESMGDAPRGTLDASLSYRFAEGRISFSDFQANAALQSGGTLRASGGIAVQPFGADLELRAQGLPLALLAPLVEHHAAVRVASGSLSGEGRLELGGKAPGYNGSLTLAGTRVVDPDGNPLFGWESLQAHRLALDFSPFALKIEDIAATAPRARVAIDAKGRLNLARVFAGGNDTGWSAKPADIRVDRLRISQGRIDFSDRSLPTPFGTTVRSVDGTVSGISTAPGEAARVRLDGRVGEYGEARVRGTVDLDAPSSLTNVSARLRNLALPEFTPYAAKFAGYRIEAGRLDGELRYRVNDGRLVGSNELVFRQLKLGEKVDSASALDLPLELAVALLTDAQGRINLAIPVSGNLNDPQFNAGGLVAKALGNALGRIVSAPFRLLASLVRGKDDGIPGSVSFEAGSAWLAPPEEETVATLAQALSERPRLELAIHAGYDGRRDERALQRQALLRELESRAGYARAAAGASRPADPADPKIVSAAEQIYLERGASSADLARLEPRRPGYGRRLVKQLAPSMVLEPHALQLLAQSRARAVQQTLVEKGADVARVAIDSARETDAAEGGIPTEFELRAR